jgi:hypothetical protein
MTDQKRMKTACKPMQLGMEHSNIDRPAIGAHRYLKTQECGCVIMAALVWTEAFV